MSNSWFRMHTEFAFDPKVQVLTEALQRRYVMALCLHCDNKLVNRPNDEIALSLRVTVEEWIETKETLIRRGLLNDECEPCGWQKRQYISDIKDSSAAERQKRYRDKKRNERNGTVTSRLPDSDTDTEREESISEDNKLSSSNALNQNRNYPEEFEKLWNMWPEERRRLKPKAYKAWLKACKRASPDYLLGCLKRYLDSREVKDGFAPYPQKWLNNEEWEQFAPPPLTKEQAAADLADAIELPGLMAMFAILQKMHPAVFRSWLSPLRVKEKVGTIITFAAPTRFTAEWITAHYLTDLTYAASQAWPDIQTVIVRSL